MIYPMKQISTRLFRSLGLLLFFSLVFAVPAQAQLSKLHFGKYKIAAIRPQGFTSASGAIEIEVTNDSTAFDMRNIAGVIYRNGKPFVQGVCQDIRVEPGASVVRAEGMVALCSGVSVWSLLGLLFSFDINEFTGDIEMDIQNAKGKVERYEKKGFSIAALLHNRR